MDAVTPLTAPPGEATVKAPPSLAGKTATYVRIEAGGVSSNIVVMPVSPTAPALYTADGSGFGQSLAYNEDGSLNSTDNPAQRGSLVTLLINAFGSLPDLAVFINSYALGVDGQVVDDMFRVRVHLPDQPPGVRLSPVWVQVAGVRSQPGVYVAVK